MESKKVIGIGEYAVDKNPAVLITLGLGSCVAACIRDKSKGIGGLVHVMLPESRGERERIGKYADTGIKAVVDEIINMGGDIRNLEAKIAGGASMFKNSKTTFEIGVKNVEAVKKNLKELGVKLVAEDTGGSRARSVEFDIATGELRVRKVGGGEKVEIVVI
ncbi:MAG TPA: chemoreceptor glutamine deamidase/glutamate methylesterase CheD [Defluviitoga sp.]|nr:chemoreceptor glutamine deamidase/glutamate methylesterase CheD [Defluviitoga sp.]HOP24890.1 chemoreceptor glutamine deamidase/glutamate methylesterase CheD [Defluviitoga sp.]HPZ28785.1 chemoreceptor glutamine deamidase/glutamate methylesterase CheD [Defluviitoga sp.]HQD62872.1 chemoreceptor glutamine deamidase/glutamate methylesterase CheD [Defluviitoga sp.]